MPCMPIRAARAATHIRPTPSPLTYKNSVCGFGNNLDASPKATETYRREKYARDKHVRVESAPG